MKKKLILLLIVALLAGAGFYWWKTQKPARVSFRPIAVERGSIRVTVAATGEVEPQNRLEIKPPIAGRIESVLVNEGDHLRKGQILAWMSSSERAALLDAAAAKGPDEVKHWEDLYRPTPLMAALPGVLIARNIEPGQTVASSDPVLVMSDRLIVKAQVDETDLAQVQLKQPSEIVLDAYPNEKIQGRVDHIAFEAQTVNNVTVYQVDVLPLVTPDAMRSGMTANVTFILDEKKDVLVVPADAIQERKGEKRVLIPSEDKKARPTSKPVEVGISDGKKTEIVSGVAEGDTILLPMSADFSLKQKNNASNPLSPWGRTRPAGGGGGGNRPSGGGGH